jgi:transposase
LSMERHPRCRAAMETCTSEIHWGGIMEAVGYEVQLIPPIYVKPFVKQQKNDANDAEAIIEASFRPTMRFVAVKPAELQAHAMVIKRRDLLAC